MKVRELLEDLKEIKDQEQEIELFVHTTEGEGRRLVLEDSFESLDRQGKKVLLLASYENIIDESIMIELEDIKSQIESILERE